MQTKNKTQFKKPIHHGYVLYDHKLDEKKLERSFLDVIQLHDVFFLNVRDRKVVKEDYDYTFDKINFLDQIALESDLQALFITKDYKTPAGFKWIYFNHELRGFYYAFDQVFFDINSVKTFIKAIEKAYYNGKFKPLGSSYYNYLKESNRLSHSHFSKKSYSNYQKKYEIKDPLKQKIDIAIQKESLLYGQLFTGLLGIYYQKQENKELIFDTNIVNEENHKIGYLFSEDAYKLKKNHTLTLSNYLKEPWETSNKKPFVEVILEPSFDDLKGKVISFTKLSSQCPLLMVIKDKKTSIDIEWHYHKNKFKKDEIHYLMLKFNHLLHCFLEPNPSPIKDIEIILDSEKETLLKYAKPKSIKENQLDLIIQSIFKNNKDKKAIETKTNHYSYGQLQSRMEKISSLLKNKMTEAKHIFVDSKDPLDLYAGILAGLSWDVLVVDNIKEGGWILSKGLFGYKLKANTDYLEVPQMNLKGYDLYLKWIRDYLSIGEEERTLVSGNFLALGLPTLLAGGCLCIGHEADIDDFKASLAVFHETPKKSYPSLKKTIVTNKNIRLEGKELYFGVQVPLAVPFVAMGRFKQGYIKDFQPAEGVGLVFLDKHMKLKPINVRGQAYIFGLGAPILGSNRLIKVDHLNINHATPLGLKGRWFYDGSIRL